jgi:hypothetical protein
VANGVGRYSFTHALNAKLKQLSQLPCYNIGHLYNAIFSEVQSWKIEDVRYLKAPVHLVLSQNHDLPRSIRLSKATPPKTRPLESESETMHAKNMEPVQQDSHISLSSSTNVASIMENAASSERSRSPSPPFPNTWLSQLSGYPRLLFSIRLSENVKACDLSSDLFADWLRSVPVSARLVTVEAGFASNSTITLVSVPAALLAYLVPDPAILLLGTIHSGNLMSERQAEEDAIQSEAHVPTPNTSSTKKAQAQGISTGIPRMATGIQSPMLTWHGGEPQFSEQEKRFVLSEAIKKSTISVEKLFSILVEHNVNPDWENMLLPPGKSYILWLKESNFKHDIFTHRQWILTISRIT